MKHSDFKIGSKFRTETSEWQVTDTGERTVIAIKLDKEDQTWYNGPPYSVEEVVFDENDFAGCYQTYKIEVRGGSQRSWDREVGIGSPTEEYLTDRVVEVRKSG